jgi:hypothetical protein
VQSFPSSTLLTVQLPVAGLQEIVLQGSLASGVHGLNAVGSQVPELQAPSGVAAHKLPDASQLVPLLRGV